MQLDNDTTPKRARVYQSAGIVLVALGLLWNLLGTLYGEVGASFSIGFVTMFIGVYYWIKGGRLKTIRRD